MLYLIKLFAIWIITILLFLSNIFFVFAVKETNKELPNQLPFCNEYVTQSKDRNAG